MFLDLLLDRLNIAKTTVEMYEFMILKKLLTTKQTKKLSACGIAQFMLVLPSFFLNRDNETSTF